MLQYLISVVQTIMPAFFMLALLSGLIKKQDAVPAKRYLIAGILCGVMTAAVLAVLRLTTGFVIRELYNAPLLVLLIVTETALLLRLSVISRAAEDTEKSFPAHLAFLPGFAWMAFAVPDMVMYPFEFNVGMDSTFNLLFLGRVTGYLAALLFACLAAMSLFRLAIRYSMGRLCRIFALALGVLYIWHLVLFLQIAVLRRWVPGFSWLVEMVMFLLQNQRIFIYGLLAVGTYAAFCAIQKSRMTIIDGANPALRRKQKIDVKRQIRRAAVLLLNMMAFLLILTVGVEINSREVELVPPVELAADAGKIAIPIDTVNDGHLHRFGYTAEDGTQMRYIVIKKGEGAFGVGLDACDVCGPSGYYERDGQIVCILCDVVINISTIGFKGGCNPVPLEYVMEDGRLIIKTAALEAEAYRFR